MSPTPQFSGLATLPLYRQLCPLVAGLGVAVHATLLARAVLNIAVVVWAARAAYDIFALLDTEAGVATVREVARLQHEAPTSEVLKAVYPSLVWYAFFVNQSAFRLSAFGERFQQVKMKSCHTIRADTDTAIPCRHCSASSTRS